MAKALNLSATIVIPSLGRNECLQRCLDSLEQQKTKHEYHPLILTEEGPLAAIRNKGLRDAAGDIVIFIDDDVVCPPDWLEGILQPFSDLSIVGVSGPAVIPPFNQRQRDLFRWPWLKRLYDVAFLEGRAKLPGHITKAGTWTTGAVHEDCSYNGEVEFLEACNMAFKRRIFQEIGGFDEAYKGIGDWSEPDAAFRLRARGGRLWFTPRAKLYHYPSRTGAYSKRRKDKARLENYNLFAERWVKAHWKHTVYKCFVRSYYLAKERGIA